jgi:hypothetical protein
MAILAGSKEQPVWLDETREFCRGASIKIVAWGPDLLTVEAKSPDRSSQIASQLGQLGFHVVENEDNAYAGLLDLSKNPAAVQAKIASFDISRRRWDEQIEPLLWAIGSLLLVPGLFGSTREPRFATVALGLLSLALFFWDGTRIWGWRLELLPEGIRIRRRYSWAAIPWEQITTIESKPANWGRNQENVVVDLAAGSSEKLGTFGVGFARNLRDRLRYELAQRRHESA